VRTAPRACTTIPPYPGTEGADDQNAMATDVDYPQAVPGLHPDPSSKAATLKRANDDMRLKIASLKSALHTERTRNQETHREKVMEMRELKDFAELEKQRAMEELKQALLEEKADEIMALQAKVEANKQREVAELMRKREKEEAERLHRYKLEQLESEKALSMRVRTETATEVADRLGRENDNLRRMIADLTDQKNKLERLYMHKSEADAGKSEQIRRMHEDQEKKTQLLLREGRKEMQREVDARRKQEERSRQLEQEVSRMSRMLNIAEAEKNTLAEDYQRLRLADAWARSSPKKAPPSIGAPKARTPMRARTGSRSLAYAPPQSNEDVLLQKKVESDRMVKDLQKKITALKKENRTLQKEATAAAAVPAQQAQAIATAKAQQSKMESLARRQQTSIKSLEKNLATTRAQLRDATNQLAESKANLVKAQNDAQSARIAASRAKPREPKEDPQLKSAYDAVVVKMERVEMQLAEKAAALDKLKKDLKTAKADQRIQREEFEDKLSQYTTRVAGSAEDKLAVLSVQHVKLEARYAALQGLVANVEETKNLRAEIDTYAARLKDANNAKEQSDAEAASAKAREFDASTKQNLLQSQLSNMEDKIASLADAHAQERNALTKSVDDLTKQYEQAIKERDEARSHVDAVKGQAIDGSDAVEMKLRDVEQNLRTSEDEVKKLSTARDEALEDLAEVRSTLEERNKYVADLKQQVADLENKTHALTEAPLNDNNDAPAPVANDAKEAAAIARARNKARKEQQQAEQEEADRKAREAAAVKLAHDLKAEEAERERLAREAEAARKLEAEVAAAKAEADAEEERARQAAEAEIKRIAAEEEERQAELALVLKRKAEEEKVRQAAEEEKRKEVEAREAAEAKAREAAKAKAQEAAEQAEKERMETEKKTAASEADAARKRAAERKKQKAAEEQQRLEEEAKAAEEQRRLEEEAKAREAAAHEAAVGDVESHSQDEGDDEGPPATSEFFECLHTYGEEQMVEEGEDLFFQENDVLKVKGDMNENGTFTPEDLDGTGYFWATMVVGSKAGTSGYVPKNFIRPMTRDEVSTVEKYLDSNVELAPNGGEPDLQIAHDEMSFADKNNQIREKLTDFKLQGLPADKIYKMYVRFDYDPHDKADSEELDDEDLEHLSEELALTRGQRVVIVSEVGDEDNVDAGGFFLGFNPLTKDIGLVPSTYVTDDAAELNMDEGDEIKDDLYEEEDPVGEVYQGKVGEIVQALHLYHPEDMSPEDDVDDQLSFDPGDRFKILEAMDEDGFYQVEKLKTNETGYVPGNYLGSLDVDIIEYQRMPYEV